MPKTLVRTGIPYTLAWDHGEVDVRVDGDIFVVRFQRRYRSAGGGDGIPGVARASNIELRRDRLARVACTQVDVVFPQSMNDIQEISGTVHAVLNRLLAVYRFTAGEFHVDMVPRNEMWPMDVFTLNDDDTIGPEVQHRESFGGGLTIARHEVIPPEARRILAHGAELPMSRTLFLNAQREELFENYRLAVVEAETAFETLVDEVISQHYKATETPISKIEGILGCGLENLLKDHIPKCCGEPFFNTTEHKAWKEDLYDLRNKVVHDGASADAVQARKALQAGANAVEWVTKRPHT